MRLYSCTSGQRKCLGVAGLPLPGAQKPQKCSLRARIGGPCSELLVYTSGTESYILRCWNFCVRLSMGDTDRRAVTCNCMYFILQLFVTRNDNKNYLVASSAVRNEAVVHQLCRGVLVASVRGAGLPKSAMESASSRCFGSETLVSAVPTFSYTMRLPIRTAF